MWKHVKIPQSDFSWHTWYSHKGTASSLRSSKKKLSHICIIIQSAAIIHGFFYANPIGKVLERALTRLIYTSTDLNILSIWRFEVICLAVIYSAVFLNKVKCNSLSNSSVAFCLVVLYSVLWLLNRWQDIY